MQDRYLLLRNWIWQVFNDNKDMTTEKLVEEFKQDVIPAMGASLKLELKALKGGKNA